MPDAQLPDSLEHSVELALAEDIRSGDLTGQLIPENLHGRARVLCRERAVLCGSPWFDAVFRQIAPEIKVHWLIKEGAEIEKNTVVCRLEGPARGLLTGERSALNFLQTLSGTATLARHYVNAIADTDCRILDTRKTVPGLRAAQKYATRMGGATNHRHGLFDGILIKENHIIACGGITNAVAAARASGASVPIEVEVESLEEVREALAAGADILLLDNFTEDDLRRAVQLNREWERQDGRPRAALEASGNITAETLTEVAATGVDFISIGALTKHVRAVDYSMRMELDAR